MKQRFLSIVLCITLMASALVGAMGVSLHSAKADNVADSGEKYFNEVISAVTALGVFSQAQLDGFFGYVAPFVRDIEENSEYMVCVCHDDNTDHWAIQLFTCATTIYSYTVNAGGTYYWGLSSANGAPGSTKFICRASLFTNGSNKNYIAWNQVISVSDYLSRNKIIDFDTVPGYQYVDWYAYPDSKNFTVSGRKFWVSHPVAEGNGTWSCSRNLFYGDIPVLDYQLKVFTLDSRTYLTSLNQLFIRNMEPDHLNWVWAISVISSDGETIYDNPIFEWNDVLLIENGQYFINGLFTNVSPLGIYAIDITQYISIWPEITFADFYELDNGTVLKASASNVPYVFSNEVDEPGTNGTPDAYTQVYTNWNTYITNYPNTPVVPQDLVPQFYNTQAASCKPCEVAVPSSLWNARSSITVFGQDIFEYHFPLVSAPAYNYELFDVCVLSRQGIVTGDILNWDYTLLWWYSDSSNPKSTKIQDLNFDVLMEMFDIIIVVDDPDLVLMDTSGDLVYTGDYEYGFTYSTDAFTYPGILYGFAFVTEKAVQKQMLFNFNDGIRKSYDLMSQYIDKRDLWDNSFLEWTTTLFSQYQTIYGVLDDIYKVLFTWDGLLNNISSKLDQIAENTSEDDPGFWFISFYNWIKRWEPSNIDFANWVDSWDDYTEDLPDPGSGVTVIPLPTSIPTAAAVGG